MSGLTSTGYSVPRLPEILAEFQAKAVELFKDLVPEGDVVNTGDTSALGRLIGLVSPSLLDAWEASQDVYDAFNINAATGVALDNLCALGGVMRKPATATLTDVILTGSAGTATPAGTKFQSTNNGKYHSALETVSLTAVGCYSAVFSVGSVADNTTYSITYQKNPDLLGAGSVTVSINSGVGATAASILTALHAALNTSPHNAVFSSVATSTTLTLTSVAVTSKVDFSSTANMFATTVKKLTTVSCDETGPVAQPIGSITRISVPIVGLDSVTNPSSGIIGNDIEPDEDLRMRYLVAKFGDGQNLIESLYSALYALDGVTSVVIVENDTDTAFTPPNPTVPPHSFYVVVLGGDNSSIASAIWRNKPAGILSYGATSVDVYDSQGVAHGISFSRPEALDIYVSLNITVLDNFAPDGIDKLKQAVADHINALLIGEDVIYSRLYTPINGVPGHYVNSLTIGTAPSPVGTSNITVAYNKKATITVDHVVVVTS